MLGSGHAADGEFLGAGVSTSQDPTENGPVYLGKPGINIGVENNGYGSSKLLNS